MELVAEKKKGNTFTIIAQATKEMPRTLHPRRSVGRCFADLLKGLVFDDQVMDWIVEALHRSHADEKRAIIRSREEQARFRTGLMVIR